MKATKRNYNVLWYSGANGDEMHELSYSSASKAGTRANLEDAQRAARLKIGPKEASRLNWNEYKSGNSNITVQLDD